MAARMKAVCIHQFGGGDELSYQDLPRPEPREGELLIRVHAAGVNPVDWKTRSGSAPWKSGSSPATVDPFPLILGWDVAGEVAATGDNVGGYAIGDAVYGMIRFPEPAGTYAEYVAAPAEHVLPKPESVGFLQAAALPLVSLTAWQALFEAGELADGQTVLIHGAAGGVGHVAVQMARWCGAHVIGTARGRDEAFLRDLGLDRLIDYRSDRFEDVVHGVDLVVDTIGGEVQERSWAVLRKGGILVTLRTSSGLAEQAAARGVRARHVLVRPNREHSVAIDRLVASGQLRPAISAVFQLPDARRAHEQLQQGPNRGKVVLRIKSDAS
jgi:NADPH:quinone reductase-like Zn-dependent oxidoreductase